jgi:serine O-acetyltransferase
VDAALVGSVQLMSADVSGRPPEAAQEMTVPPLREAIRGDLAQMAKVKETRYPSIGGAIDILSIPGTWAVIIFRLASTAHHKGIRPVSRFLFFMNTVLFGVELHPGAIVQPGLVIPHPVGMGFASGCRIGKRCLMLRGTAMGGAGNPKRPGQPRLGDDVTLLDSAKVLGPVYIGDRSMIGTNAVVVDDVPPDTFVYGVRKSDTMRPLAEMGLGEQAEAEIGYGAAGRRAATADPPTAEPITQNGHRPVEVT